MLLPAAYQAHRRRALQTLNRYLTLICAHFPPNRALMLVVPTPPLNVAGHWNQLTPLLLSPRITSHDDGLTVSSDTTQTFGLVSSRDIAPTLLSWLNVPSPLQMTGAPLRPVGRLETASTNATLPRLQFLDRQTRLNQEAQDPLFWGIGLLAPALIFPALALFLTGRMARGSRLCHFAPYAMRLLASWPLALLFAPLLHPLTVGVYLALIALLTLVIALLPTPALIFSLTALILIGDGLTGTALVSQSVLSAYALAGIRFYGIGNEYMGVLLGGALLAAATTRMTPPVRRTPSGSPEAGKEQGRWPVLPSPLAPITRTRGGWHGARNERSDGRGSSGLGLLLWFTLVTIVLSCPAFGAKAGGAVTAAATFTLAWLRLRRVRLKFRHLLVGLAAGFVLVFLWALLGDVLHLRRTHLETAVGALEGGRFGYIWGVSLRKVGLAVRVFRHPGTLLGILALILIGLVARTVLWPHLVAHYQRHPRLAAASEAGLWGSAVCVLFNDSGIVAAILLLMCLILPVLHGLFQRSCASLPSMSAMSESASPSVTP